MLLLLVLISQQKKQLMKENSPVLYSVANSMLLSEEVPVELKVKTLGLCTEWVIDSTSILEEQTLLATLYKYFVYLRSAEPFKLRSFLLVA